MANVRIHCETHQKPIELFEKEKLLLKALPVMPYDCAVIQPADANRCYRVAFQSNRYSVPYLYASQKLTLKIYPDQLLFFHNQKLIVTHPLTTNKPFKHWSSIFNNDGTIASAVLDRLLHHADTVVIEGPSYRMKDQQEPKE